jgi:5-methylcytosine-specific restriction endonuclease McrA
VLSARSVMGVAGLDGWRMPGDPWLQSREWREFRARVLRLNPVCSVAGCGDLATDVDHVVSRANGGALLDPRNCQVFCHAHHSQKTARNDRPAYRNSRRPVVATGCDAAGNPVAPNKHWLK